MKGVTIIASLAMGCGFALLFGLGDAARAAEPYGTWLRPSTGSQVRFYNCGGKLCAKVIAVKDQARKGEIGKSILHGAVKSGENTWTGELTDAGTGKVYSGTVTLESATALSLQGCVARILCQSETWTKVK
jgi:uncharacterized protein (DUF2147 family)